jgi:hypothetical protein
MCYMEPICVTKRTGAKRVSEKKLFLGSWLNKSSATNTNLIIFLLKMCQMPEALGPYLMTL